MSLTLNRGTFHSDDVIGSSPRVKKLKKNFFAFFYELSHSDSKNAIKFFWLDFSPLWGHVTWDLEFFSKISKFSNFFFRLFFRIESFWVEKNEKNIFVHYEVRSPETFFDTFQNFRFSFVFFLLNIVSFNSNWVIYSKHK